MPIFLWSTVVAQSWSTAVQGNDPSLGSCSTTAMMTYSLQGGFNGVS